MNSLFMGKYRPAVILTLALTVFLASCKGTCDDPKSWVVSTIAGTGTAGFANTGDTDADGNLLEPQFNKPFGVAVDSSGENLYVADTVNNCIRKVVISTGAASTLAGTGTPGSADTAAAGADPAVNPAVVATFNGPQGVAVDLSGNLYVADSGNHLIRKIVISEAGEATVTTIAGTGAGGYKDKYSFPVGVAADSSGNVYVADTANNRIRKITSAGVGSTLAGSGTLEEFEFNPHGIAVDSSGNVYVADTENNRIRKITSAGVVTTGVVTSTEAQFYHPEGVAVDSSDNLYVADTENNLIRKITFTTSNDVITATVSTIAGTGIATTATFNAPAGVAVDSSGNLYVADTYNHRIRKIEYK